MRNRAGLRGRRPAAEQGSAAIEFVLLAPLLMVCVLIVVQFALWQHARHVLLAAAQEGARAARAQGGSAEDGRLRAHESDRCVVTAPGTVPRARPSQGAARDAARAASLERSATLAAEAARRAAAANLAERGVSCASFDVTVDTAQFRPGGQVRVTVTCASDLSGLALSGLPGTKTLQADATAPLEQYRGVK